MPKKDIKKAKGVEKKRVKQARNLKPTHIDF